MKIEEFEKELKELNADLTIVPSRDPALAEVRYQGAYICAIPNNDIYDEANAAYGIELPSGTFIPHRSRTATLGLVKGMLDRINSSQDEKDAFFGTGPYSDKELGIREGTDIPITVEAEVVEDSPKELPEAQ